MTNSYIVLSDVESGTPHNYPVAYFDWARMYSIDPTIGLQVDSVNSQGALAFMVDRGSTNTLYYQLGTFQGPYANAYLNNVISGAIPPSEGGGRLVGFQRPEYWDNPTEGGNVLQTGDAFSLCFLDQGTPTIPPADIDGFNTYYTQSTIINKNLYSILGTWTPQTHLYKNKKLSRDFVTTSGNHIGACMGIGSSAYTEFAYVNGPNYLSGLESGGSNIPNISYMATVGDYRVYTDGISYWMSHLSGGAAPTYGTAGFVYSHSNPYEYLGEHHQDPVVVNEVSVQMIATIIDGQEYLGMAAIRWVGSTIDAISVVFYPNWYWGTYYIDPESKPPSTDNQYFGPVQPPARGGNGNYTYNNSTVIETTTPQSVLSNFTWYDPGIHIYELTGSHIKSIVGKIWEKGDYSIVNNSVGAILSFGYLPTVFYKGGTSTSTVVLGNDNVQFSGDTLPQHLNSSQFVRVGTFSLRVLPFFGNYLDYEGYTSMKLYLPFIGSVDIPPSSCIGNPNDDKTGWIRVIYRCDVATGNVVAEIICIDQYGFQTVQYATGNCLIKFPIYGNALSQQEMLGSVSGAVSGIASTVTGIASGNFAATIGGAFQTANSIMRANNPQQHNQVASNFNGNNSAIGNKRIYLVVTRPQPAYDDNYVKFKGAASSKYVDTINDVYEYTDSFTVIEYAKATDISYACEEEKREIEKLLSEGVYINATPGV